MATWSIPARSRYAVSAASHRRARRLTRANRRSAPARTAGRDDRASPSYRSSASSLAPRNSSASASPNGPVDAAGRVEPPGTHNTRLRGWAVTPRGDAFSRTTPSGIVSSVNQRSASSSDCSSERIAACAAACCRSSSCWAKRERSCWRSCSPSHTSVNAGARRPRQKRLPACENRRVSAVRPWALATIPPLFGWRRDEFRSGIR